jgi:mono/diheme cytochrome c family protein
VTPEYGHYLAITGGCTGCHGSGLSGGAIPGVPPDFPKARNISPTGIGSWSDEDFFRALREGKRPDGSTINPFMPWNDTKLMTDDEIRALLAYLRTVPPRPDGQR